MSSSVMGAASALLLGLGDPMGDPGADPADGDARPPGDGDRLERLERLDRKESPKTSRLADLESLERLDFIHRGAWALALVGLLEVRRLDRFDLRELKLLKDISSSSPPPS
mmetsp:Transcript_19359/g.47854  ORF Transcript_19359/g.47854 Transcript_19359/m.47854 type:complete len:111 (+) Transcript_19359:581-913(+)